MARGRSTAAVIAAVLAAAACTGGGDDSAPTTPPPTPDPTTIDTTTGSATTDTQAEDTIVDTVDELEVLEDVVAEEDAPPATRTEELALRLADGEPPTLQEAVDLFDLVYGPFPGATPSDLPPGEGLGTTFTLSAIEAVREQLTPDQLAALEAIEGAVEAEVAIDVSDGSVTIVDPAGPATTAPATPSSPPATDAAGPTTGPQGMRARQASDAVQRYTRLAQQAARDWLQYRPGLPMPPFVVQVMTQPKAADMDAFPLPRDPRQCRVRVFPQLMALNPDDTTIRYAFAHELFHCVQYQWGRTGRFGLVAPDWLAEGSASFAMLDLYRDEFDPPERYTPVPWFTRAGSSLATRTYSAWPLFETAMQDNRDVYGSIERMVRSAGQTPEELLSVGGLDGQLFRMRWASNSTRATQLTAREWQLVWPNTFRSGGPLDNKVNRGSRGLGTYRVTGSKDYGHQTVEVTMTARVGLVVATPKHGPLTTNTAEGTVVVAEGMPGAFCFSPGGCECPGGTTSEAHDMDGREMVFSFPAGRLASFAQVHAVEWNPDEHCEPERRTRRGSSNGDPHLISFDGSAFDVHAPGELVLVRDPTTTDLEIQVRHEPWPILGSGTTAVAVRTGDRRITFTAESLASEEQPVVRVDGEEVGATDDDVAVGGDPTGTYPVWDVEWPDGTVLHLRWYFGWSIDLDLAIDRVERIEGLLGPSNGDPRDDLALTDGTLLSPEDQDRIDTDYVEPWFVDDETTLFDYEPGESPQRFRDAERPPIPPRADDETHERCESALGEAATSAEVRACAFDVIATGQEGFVEFYDTVVDRRVAATPSPVVVPMEDEPDDAPPGAQPVPDGAALVLAGTLWDGYSLTDDPDAVGELTGALELEEGAVVVARAERCPTDVDVRLDITERGSDAGAATVRVCDAYGFNGATAGELAEVVAGESYALITRAGTYDLVLTAVSPTPVFLSVVVFADPTPTVIDGDAALSDGARVTLDGVADSMVMLLETETGASWSASGLDEACGGEVYGPALGEGGAWTIAFCDHRVDEIVIGPTGDLAVPLVAFARTDEPVTVELRPTG